MVRLKNRYLLVQIIYPDASSPAALLADPIKAMMQHRAPTPSSLTPQLLTRTIRSEIATLYGDYGVGVTSSSLAIKYLSPATSTFILRVARAHYRLAWAALSFITKLPPAEDRPCVLHVVRVSGTIRKAEEEAVRRAREMVARGRKVLGWLGREDGGGEEEEEDGDDKDMVDEEDESGEEGLSRA